MNSCCNLYMILTCSFYNAFQNDNNLKLLVHEGALGQVEKWALGIDLMTYRQG